MLELFSSLATGGIVGILGSLGTGVLTYFTKKSERAHELEMEKARRDTAIAVTESKTKAAIGVGELKAFSDSYKHDTTSLSSEAGKSSMVGRILFSIVDFIRALVRPAMCAILVWMTYHIYTDMNTIVVSFGAEVFSVEDAVSIIKQVILLILSLTATAVGWYFSDRHLSKIFKLK